MYRVATLDTIPLTSGISGGDRASIQCSPTKEQSKQLRINFVILLTLLLRLSTSPRSSTIRETKSPPRCRIQCSDVSPSSTLRLFISVENSSTPGLPPLIRVKEPELMDKIGLDAVAFLRFNRLLRWLFTGIAALTCGILIPINVVYNLKNVKEKKRDVLSMLTIRDVGGNLLFAHVAVTYLITILVCVLVWIHWKQMVALRRQWFRSPEYLESFYARTLAITHIPKKLQSDAGIRDIYESVKVPYPATSVHINRKVGKLPELIEFHNNTVRELETHLVKYLKGGKLGKKRPVIKIGATLGMGGKKVDAIDHFTYVSPKT
jgi:calcium permeable stress-gated cation channel